MGPVRRTSVPIEDLVISNRITRAPRDYQKAGITAIVAQQLFGCGVKLRPGETVEYVITDAGAKVPNERVRAYSLWKVGMDTTARNMRPCCATPLSCLSAPLHVRG